ncbi:hypothetical protein [Comamonas sediminis]|uniref:Uncharacterized protein n=1 Tax=Comamonas sediminis TaxID=1783360 RepID=A0ABV4B2H1_9BURK
MFKFSAYPPESFWDTIKRNLAIAAIPSPQEQGSKTPSEKEKQDQEQGQQAFLTL